jgi:homoserine/homoserine lactone efflux protein
MRLPLGELNMVWQTWFAYVTVVFIVIVTPGPAAALCMTHAAANGALRTLPTILGLLLSSVTLIGMSAAGLGLALATSGTVFTVIKLCGAAYLIYLGVRIWRSPASNPTNDRAGIAPSSSAALFRTGYLVGVSNPKDLLFFGALFPQFLDPAREPLMQLLVLSVTWLVLAGVITFCYAVAGFRLAAALNNIGPRNLFNRLTGGALVVAGGLLAFTKRSSA